MIKRNTRHSFKIRYDANDRAIRDPSLTPKMDQI